MENNDSHDSSKRGTDNYGGGYGGYSSGAYGGYGGYYYGYGNAAGYGGYGGGAEQPQRSLKDYLMILRERIWYFVVTFFIIFTGTLLYTLNATPLYTSVATVRILRQSPDVLKMGSVQDDSVRGAEDFNTQVRIMESAALIDAVANRLSDEERNRLMAPYEDTISFRGPMTPHEVLARGRSVLPLRLTLVVGVQFTHPDPEIAMLIANLFADEFIQHNLRRNIEISMRAVEDLRTRVDAQRNRVQEIQRRLVEYRDQHGLVSLKQDENIDREELATISRMVTEDKRILDTVETQYNMVLEYQAEGRPLYDLSFIAQSPQVANLLSKRSEQNISIAALSKRYRERHPRMIEAVQAYEQTEAELAQAIQSEVEKIKGAVASARRNYDQSSKRLAEKERQILDIGHSAVEYNSIERELEVNNALYQVMVQRLETEMANVTLVEPNVTLIDQARIPSEPSSPQVLLNLAVGFFGGIAAGFGLVFVMAFLDDRVKTTYDIETAIGLPLIGVVPRIKKMNSPEKARAVASNRDSRVTESFRAIHSALRIGELSRKARLIATTSTTPSEGKSFISTNLALTFAIHGEKTLIIDADLRMPNVGKSLELSKEVGMIQYFNGEVSLDDAIIKDYYPNLDVLQAGGKAKNPTQILNSPEFESMLAELSERYDRIFIDTPPIGAVSDIISILPYVDGLLYVIKFNAVKKRNAKAHIRRILEANTPVFGCVLNQINVSVASYYYSHYYDKSYQNYYQHASEDAVDVTPGQKKSQKKDQTEAKI